MTYENIEIEIQDYVGIITLNRPEALNALCADLISELGNALDDLESNDDIGCIVLTGSEKAFAAGADIKEMEKKTFISAYMEDFITGDWEKVSNCRKPIIAAVAGFALGGGSEIALSCDLRLATPRSKFGTPEINLGLIPGGGGTQRLCRLLGYGRAMEMVLSGEMIGGEEANRIGLINHLVDEDSLREKTMEIAQNLATKSPHTIRIAKAAVRTALEQPFSAGIQSERDLFCELFDTADMAIGVKAFLNRETAEWTGA